MTLHIRARWLYPSAATKAGSTGTDRRLHSVNRSTIVGVRHICFTVALPAPPPSQDPTTAPPTHVGPITTVTRLLPYAAVALPPRIIDVLSNQKYHRRTYVYTLAAVAPPSSVLRLCTPCTIRTLCVRHLGFYILFAFVAYRRATGNLDFQWKPRSRLVWLLSVRCRIWAYAPEPSPPLSSSSSSQSRQNKTQQYESGLVSTLWLYKWNNNIVRSIFICL